MTADIDENDTIPTVRGSNDESIPSDHGINEASIPSDHGINDESNSSNDISIDEPMGTSTEDAKPSGTSCGIGCPLRHITQEIWGIPLFIYFAIIVYIGSLLYISFIGFYVVPDLLFILSFIIILPYLRNVLASPLLGDLRKRELRDKLIAVFVLALLLRGVLLVNDEVITNDIDLYVERSDALVNGSVPYVDKEMHKPPMYAYMLFALGHGLGPDHMRFRAFFSIIDSFVAIAVFYLLRKKYDESYSLFGAVAYAICPINVISTGLEGHYDPLVSIFLIWSLIMYFKHKNTGSSLSLGIAFAFKLYPFIFAPFLVWKLKTWKERIWYSIMFFVPMGVSFLPLYIINPKTWEIYWDYQNEEWMNQAMKSFAKAYELVALDLGWADEAKDIRIMGVIHTDFFLYLFMLITGLMFLLWVWSRLDKKETEDSMNDPRWSGLTRFIPDSLKSRFIATLDQTPEERKERIFLLWYKIIFITFIVYYGTQIMTGFFLYEGDFKDSLGIQNPWIALAISGIVYFGLTAFILYRFGDYLFPKKMEAPEKEEMFVLGAFSIMFLLFGSPDYPTWYIMWFIPLVLGIRTDRIRNMLFAIMLWNVPGEGIKLWKGKSLAEERY